MRNQVIGIQDFFSHAKHGVIVDVRSPKEYANGHMPGAKNLPLFTDEERHNIGVIYKQEGHQKAVYHGLEVVGPRLTSYIDTAAALAPQKTIYMYCWRGGMRSNSLALLLRTAGFTVYVLKDGYKAYRGFVHQQFTKPLKLINIGGFTGTGKTEILHYLAKNGYQVIDLEGLAQHQGSAFGNLENHPQPTTEHFENLLAETIIKSDQSRIIFTEDESVTIGKVRLPHAFFESLQRAPLLFLQQHHIKRQERLANQYGNATPETVAAAFIRLKKRLGGLNLAEALKAVANNDINHAAQIALQYYDKSYYRGLEKRAFVRLKKINANNPIDVIAQDLITVSQQIYERT